MMPDILLDVHLPPDINTEVWILNKELPKSIELIKSKIWNNRI